MNNDNDIDSIIEELRNDSVPSTNTVKSKEELKEAVTDENVGEYVIKNLQNWSNLL
jgi:hypothetical protein